MISPTHRVKFSLVLSLALPFAACSSGTRTPDESAPAPVDSGTPDEARSDTLGVPDTLTSPGTPPEGATPPITPPSESMRDTPPSGGGTEQTGEGPKVSQAEYEGWRQYSVNCARCHGQDVLPNPVAANLLISVAPGGPVATQEAFTQVVTEGRPARGMPAFKGVMTPEQIGAVFTYVQGRAAKRIPPGRPARPGG